jgi:hypothetical protein
VSGGGGAASLPRPGLPAEGAAGEGRRTGSEVTTKSGPKGAGAAASNTSVAATMMAGPGAVTGAGPRGLGKGAWGAIGAGLVAALALGVAATRASGRGEGPGAVAGASAPGAAAGSGGAVTSAAAPAVSAAVQVAPVVSAVATAASAAPVASVAVAPAEGVEIKVESVPPAEVFRGAEKLGAAPGTLIFKRDEGPVKLTFKAAGYQPKTVDVRPASGEPVSVKLTKVPEKKAAGDIPNVY